MSALRIVCLPPRRMDECIRCQEGDKPAMWPFPTCYGHLLILGQVGMGHLCNGFSLIGSRKLDL